MANIIIPIICAYLATIIAIVLILIFIFDEIKRKKSIVFNNSSLIKSLNKLNKEYENAFSNDILDIYHKTYRCNSKQKFDRYDTDKYFFDIIYNGIEYYSDVISKIISNQRYFLEYNEHFKQLKSTITKNECKELKITYKSFQKIENNYIKKHKLNPVMDTCIVCNVEYTSPKGRNHYSQKSIYSFNNIKETLKTAKLQLEYDNSREARKQFERNKLTKSMRYDVLRRDNFKCVLCGKFSQDGSILHVDHIIPIARGGKTVLSNLRTLCDECNLGKGTKE